MCYKAESFCVFYVVEVFFMFDVVESFCRFYVVESFYML